MDDKIKKAILLTVAFLNAIAPVLLSDNSKDDAIGKLTDRVDDEGTDE